MAKLSDKSELVDKAASIFRMKGYSGTSIDDIAKACGITKGSIYHHFAGKEELASATLDMVHDYYRDHIFSILSMPTVPTVEDLRLFNKAVENFFNEHRDGCLLANLSLESGANKGPFKAKIEHYFAEWSACYKRIFLQLMPEMDAKAYAEDTLAVVQGCILMGRIKGNFTSLARQHARIIDFCNKAVMK